MTTPLEILKGARDLLDGGKNWIHGNYHAKVDGVDNYCAIAAVNAAAFDNPMGQPFGSEIDQEKVGARDIASAILAKAMGRHQFGKGNQVSEVIEFNDLKGRTASEVLAAFDRAIAELEKD